MRHATIRLAWGLVTPGSVSDDKKIYQFTNLSGERPFKLNSEEILNLNEVDMLAKSVLIVTPAQSARSVFDCVTFTVEVRLP